ncbi:MAG: polysaccharide biosynthesis protein [Rhodospirillales bacterium]|nr:polysaccharide biosynthesis protein [Rhodospirillales bacterium]
MKRLPGAIPLISAASKGVFWFLCQTVASRVVQFLAQIILAWILSPADFGQVSLALAVATIVSACFNFGLEDVLLQRHRALRLWAGTVFWLSLAIGLAGSLILLIAAQVAARAYDEPQLAGLISIAALGAPIASLETIPGTIIRSSLNFRVLALAALGEAVAVGAMSIALAVAGFGPYSLVLPSPVAAAGRVCVLWWIARPKIAGRGIQRRWPMLMPSAGASLGTRLLLIMMSQADYVILGFVVGEIEVGIYYFAFKLAIQPLRMLAGSMTSVLFPTLVQYRDDPARQLEAALTVSEMLSVVVMPACFLQAALTSPLLQLFFAAKWEAAGPLVQLLSIGFAFDVSSWAAGAFLNARGEFRRAFLYTSLAAPTFLAFVAAGALMRGALGVAAAVASYYVLVQPIYSYRVFTRAGEIGWREIARIYAAPVLLGAATVAAASLMTDFFDRSPWFALSAIPPIALAAYIPISRLFGLSAHGPIGS